MRSSTSWISWPASSMHSSSNTCRCVARLVTTCPPSRAQLGRLLDRLGAIASAVDERYVRLGSAVASDPLFGDDLLDELRSVIVEDGPTHVEAFAALRNSLGDLRPEDLLIATRREGTDALERRMQEVSDRSHGLVLAILQER